MRECGSDGNHMRAKIKGVDLALEWIMTWGLDVSFSSCAVLTLYYTCPSISYWVWSLELGDV